MQNKITFVNSQNAYLNSKGYFVSKIDYIYFTVFDLVLRIQFICN